MGMTTLQTMQAIDRAVSRRLRGVSAGGDDGGPPPPKKPKTLPTRGSKLAPRKRRVKVGDRKGRQAKRRKAQAQALAFLTPAGLRDVERRIERRIERLEGKAAEVEESVEAIAPAADAGLVERLHGHGLPGDEAGLRKVRSIVASARERFAPIDGAALKAAVQGDSMADRFETQAAASAGMNVREYRKATRGAR